MIIGFFNAMWISLIFVNAMRFWMGKTMKGVSGGHLKCVMAHYEIAGWREDTDGVFNYD